MKRVLQVCAGLFMVMFLSASLESAVELVWNADQQIEDGGGSDATSVQVAVDGDVAVAVWRKDYIYVDYSDDGGVTWHSDVRIDDNGGADAYEPQVAVSGSNVVVAWSQYYGTTYNIYIDYSTDGGATWHSDQTVESLSGSAMAPQVAISGNNAVVVWRQADTTNNIYANYGTISGDVLTWHTAVPIEATSNPAESPQVAMSGSNVVAVWQQYDGSSPNKKRIYSNYSVNSGASWGTAQLIENNTGYDGYLPEVAMSGNNVVAVWSQYNSSGYRHIYSNYSTTAGQVWVGDQQVEYNTYQGEYQKVAIDGSNAVIVWRQDDGVDYGIYSSYSADGGATWGTAQLIENNNGQASDPDVAISGSNAVAVWYQNDGSNIRIYSNYSLDGGATWGSDGLVDDNAGHNGQSPRLAISGTTPVVVWYQQDDSYNNRIYSTYGEFVDIRSDSGCFIATAAFGTPAAKQLGILRRLRDGYLLTNVPGRHFVAWYYKNGPVAAGYIGTRPALRAVVRLALYPLIIFSFILIKGMLPYLVLFLCGTAVFLRMRLRVKSSRE